MTVYFLVAHLSPESGADGPTKNLKIEIILNFSLSIRKVQINVNFSKKKKK